MVTLRSFKTALEQVLTDAAFWLAAAGVFLLAMLAQVYRTDTGGAVPAVQAVLLCAAGRAGELEGISGIEAARDIRSASYLATFLPVLAGFPAAPLLIDRRRYGWARLAVGRSGLRPNRVGELLAGWAGGGLAVLLGYLAAAFPVLFFLPPWKETFLPFADMFLPEGPFAALYPVIGQGAAVLAYAADMFLYGAFFSLPALFLAGRMRNKYLVLCLPLLLRFLYDTLLSRRYREQAQTLGYGAAAQTANWFSSRLAEGATHPAPGIWLWMLGGLGLCLFFSCFLAEGAVDVGQ